MATRPTKPRFWVSVVDVIYRSLKTDKSRSSFLVNTVVLSSTLLVERSHWIGHCTCRIRNATEAAQIQANRAISTGKLHALPHFHTQPINVVVSHGSQGRISFEAGFPLRCFQRLSLPNIATRLCRWRDNRSTRGSSTPVLSY